MQKPAFKGRLSAIEGDFGAFLIGDFSALETAGTYEVRTAEARSPSFRIAPDVYADAIKSAVRYFSVQRCGASKTGWQAHRPTLVSLVHEAGRRRQVPTVNA